MGNSFVTNGADGGKYVTHTNAVAMTGRAVQVIADAKFHTLAGNLEDVANTTSGSAPVIPAGTIFYGYFTSLQLHSGAVVFYR